MTLASWLRGRLGGVAGHRVGYALAAAYLTSWVAGGCGAGDNTAGTDSPSTVASAGGANAANGTGSAKAASGSGGGINLTIGSGGSNANGVGGANVSGAGGANANGAGGGGSGGGNNCQAPVTLALAPMNLAANVTPKVAFSKSYAATASYAKPPQKDVTADSLFTISDPTLGTFQGSVFTWAGVHGGTAVISAKTCGVIGTTNINLTMAANSGLGGVDAVAATSQFGAAQPSNKVGCAPTLVYPPDGVLLPPNTNVLEVHFLEGSGNTLFELSFSNSVTDVKLYTNCKGATPDKGMPLNGGCVVSLSQDAWDWIAQTNRDGDPVTVKVRAMGCDGGNVMASAKRDISFAKEDFLGALYYWASVTVTINAQVLNSGGIFRYNFGVPGQTADPVLTPTSAANPNKLCIGCHTVSRDGSQLIFDFDDNDNDDEYGDVTTDIYNIITKTPIVPIVKNNNLAFPAGYHTWNHSGLQFLLSDGKGNTATPKKAFRRVSSAGATLGYTQPGTLWGTTPDWANDDSQVVFSAAPNVTSTPPTAGYWGSDEWFAGASLYVASWSYNTSSLAAPTTLLASNGTNNYYYPTFSPDVSLIAFNYAASGANFHNANARVQLIAAGQANPTPVDLAKLNDVGSLTNSWARWAPFVQKYKGGQILWLTSSSTRNYGLRIINNGKQNCYPTESPITPFITQVNNCNRAQLWMAAVKLDVNAVKNAQDVSFPMFWLPFQDLGTNNHLAQWAENEFAGPCKANADCGVGQCCVNPPGGCAPCPPKFPPPKQQPDCTTDANCSAGNCCITSTCQPCPMGTTASSSSSSASASSSSGGGCDNCLQCNGQACIKGQCGSCESSAQCCAPLQCFNGICDQPIN